MDFLQLEYFCAVAQAGNITKAANALMISQPSLSQTIIRLEKDMDAPLFVRSPRGITLTRAGELFYTYASGVLRGKADVARQIGDLADDIAGEINVRTHAMSYVIARLFCDFNLLYPNVTINLKSYQSDRQLAPARDLFRTADLFVTTQSAAAFRAESTVLVEEELMAAFPPNHPLHDRESVALEELAGEKFVIQQEGELRGIVEGYCRLAGFEPNIMLECVNTNTLFGVVASGMGVALFPRSWKRLHNDSISVLPIVKPSCTRTIRLLWDAQGYTSKAALCFRNYIIENIRTQLETNFF